MTIDRIALLSLLALAGHACASAPAAAPTASAAAAAAAAPAAAAPKQFVTLRGPEENDCQSELAAARGAGDPSSVFLTEFKCRVYPAWKCRESCKGDELMVTHVALRIGPDGALKDTQVVQKSERADFDGMSVEALKTGAPYPAPPAPLLDGAGAAAFNVEFACDCVRRRPRQ